MLKYLLRFLIAAGLQVFILNNIELNGLINPFFYIIFLLLLPFDTPRGLLIILAFLLGFTVDMFSHTYGMHSAATVMIAFLRPLTLERILPRENMEPQSSPSLVNLGFQDFIKYILVLTFIHHFVLFNMEVFRLGDFLFTFLRVFISTVFTSILIIISQLFFFKK